MKALPLRLRPGDDLRRSIETAVIQHGADAAFVLSGIGSLAHARLRLAGENAPRDHAAPLELLTLAGSIGNGTSHLHAAIATAAGDVIGGHVAYGCTVRTTAELLLVLLDEFTFSRAPDAATGFDELVIETPRR